MTATRIVPAPDRFAAAGRKEGAPAGAGTVKRSYAIHSPSRMYTVGPDARRVARQREAIQAGWHPLGLSPEIRRLKLHQDAAKATHASEEAGGLRCRDCRFRELFGRYAKCTYGGKPYQRITHGPGTDVRAWWPACVDYQPIEASA